ncbi:hypothetical protein Tco_0087992 [Tanacetum coccineum]
MSSTGEYYWAEFRKKVANLIDKYKDDHMKFKKNNPSSVPTYSVHGFAWALKDLNPITLLRVTNEEIRHNRCRKSYDYVNVDNWEGVTRELDKIDVVLHIEKASFEVKKYADRSSGGVRVEETNSKVRVMELENQVKVLTGRMAILDEIVKMIVPGFPTPTTDAKHDST